MITPLIEPNIDWDALEKLIPRSAQVLYEEGENYVSFLGSVGLLSKTPTDPKNILTKIDQNIFRTLQFTFGVYEVEEECMVEALQINIVNVTYNRSIGVWSGTLFQWFQIINEVMNGNYSYDLRTTINGVYIYLKHIGFGLLWASNQTIKLSDGSLKFK